MGVGIQAVLDRLECVRACGKGQFSARCPAHPDRNPSLSVSEGEHGRVLLTCHAKCQTQEIAACLGLSMRDLGPTNEPPRASPRPDKKRHYSSEHELQRALLRSTGGRIAKVWTYTKPDGTTAFKVVRFDSGGGEKTFRVYHQSAGGWVAGDPPGALPLYALTELRPGAAAFVVEGEQCADALRELGLTATTSAHGARSPHKSDWTPLTLAKKVLLLPDHDDAGLEYANKVRRILGDCDPDVCVVQLALPDLEEGEDIVDWLASGHDVEELMQLVREAENQRLPQITLSSRQLRDVTSDVLDALVRQNTPPRLFRRGMDLVRVRFDVRGSPVIEPLTPKVLRHHVARAASFFKTSRDGKSKPCVPSLPPIEDLLAASPLEGFPELRGIIEAPTIRPDGSILQARGYDPSTGLYLAPEAGLTVPRISDDPTKDGVLRAVAFLRDEVLHDFPFDRDGPDGSSTSQSNALALLITPVIRHLIDGPIPMAVIDAPEMGSGKTLLATVVSVIATGREPGLFPPQKSDEECRKQLTSLFLAEQSVVLIDNVMERLEHPSLAAALTSRVWNDRILQQSKSANAENHSVFIATGNNIQLGGDLPRRAYWIRLDPRDPAPSKRTGFRHDPLIPWLKEQRGTALAAILTICRYGLRQRPEASPPRIGSFEEWSSLLHRCLVAADVTGFLAPERPRRGSLDLDRLAATSFLEMLLEFIGTDSFTVAELGKRLTEDDRRSLAEVAPEGLLDVGQLTTKTRRLGTWFAAQDGRVFGPAGIRVERVGTKSNAAVWKLVPRSSPTPGESDESDES